MVKNFFYSVTSLVIIFSFLSSPFQVKEVFAATANCGQAKVDVVLKPPPPIPAGIKSLTFEITHKETRTMDDGEYQLVFGYYPRPATDWFNRSNKQKPNSEGKVVLTLTDRSGELYEGNHGGGDNGKLERTKSDGTVETVCNDIRFFIGGSYDSCQLTFTPKKAQDNDPIEITISGAPQGRYEILLDEKVGEVQIDQTGKAVTTIGPFSPRTSRISLSFPADPTSRISFCVSKEPLSIESSGGRPPQPKPSTEPCSAKLNAAPYYMRETNPIPVKLRWEWGPTCFRTTTEFIGLYQKTEPDIWSIPPNWLYLNCSSSSPNIIPSNQVGECSLTPSSLTKGDYEFRLFGIVATTPLMYKIYAKYPFFVLEPNAPIPSPPTASVPSPTPCTDSKLCTLAGGDPCSDDPKDPNPGFKTAIGCIHTRPEALAKDILTFAVAISGGLAFLMMLLGAYQMLTSQGNPDALNAGKDRLTNAVIGLLFVIFSVLLLQIIGVDILQLPWFG